MGIKINTKAAHTANFNFSEPLPQHGLFDLFLKVVTFPLKTITKNVSYCRKNSILERPAMHNKSMLDITRISQAGKKVYLGFILLDMVNDKANNYFILNNKKGLSLNEYVTQLVKDRDFNKDIQIGRKECKICIEKTSNTEYLVKITCDPQFHNCDNNLKTKNKYNDNDFLSLCNTHELTFICNNSGKYAFSTKIGKHAIGGPDKINLYSIHISNLYQMINHITSHTGNINTLVAMTTGSGKSFTQALWAFVLHCAGYHGVFAVHQDALVNQLAEDFHRLLPSTVTKKIKTYDQKTTDSIHPNSHIITTHDILLKQKLHEFENKKYWISVDEAHNATKVELYKKNIENLKGPILFLTATPSKFTTEKVGHTINLSPKKKEEQGICKRAITIIKIAKCRIPKAQKTSSFGERLSLGFADIIEQERLSTAHECLSSIEECIVYRQPTDPFYVKNIENNDKNIRKNLRWNVPLPIGEKLLGLLGRGNCDGVINFHLALNSNSAGSAYENGNKISRKNVYNFFQLRSLTPHKDRLDEAYLEKYEASKKELRKSSLCNYLMNHYKCNLEQAKCFVESNLDYSNNAAKYQELNVLHGIIENTISYLTGYNSIELNHKRRHDLASLIREVKTQLSISTSQHKIQMLGNLLNEGIPEDIAKDVATQMRVVLDTLDIYRGDDCGLERMIDNWSLDKKIHDDYSASGLLSRLQDFCKKHKTIFLVNELEKTAVQVKNNSPFFHLKEKKFKLQEDGLQELKIITKHKLSTIEALDDTTEQYYYEPEYCPAEYTEKVIDKLFKKGLIGSYITSEKTTGFNDLNLCTIGIVIDSTEENINTPHELIQSDRNRKLDWAKQPTYHLVTKPGVTLSFDINHLAKGNYISALNTAEKKHNQELVKRLGSNIAKQIQDYIDLNADLSGKIDSNSMENKLLEIIWNEYEYLYNQNNHDPKKTKSDFIHALNEVYKILNACEDTIKKNYQLSISAHVIAFTLELITKVIYLLTTYSSRKEFKEEIKKLKYADNSAWTNEKTYTHIVQNYQYKNIISNGFALKTLLTSVQKRLDHSKNFVIKNPNKFIKKEKKIQLNKDINSLLNQTIAATTNLTQEQKEKMSQYTATKEDWINEVANYDTKNDNMAFSIFSSDPIIRQYLRKEKITKFEIPPDRVMQIGINSLQLQSSLQELLTDCKYITKKEHPTKIINKDKIEKYITKSVSHYFQSEVYSALLNYYIAPLNEEILLAILNAIYPLDKNNQQKIEKIQKFRKGINNGEQFAEIVNTCGGMQETHDISKYLGEICQEILHCHCYYHNIGEKGDPNWSDHDRENDPIAPKLYRNRNPKEHKIWEMGGSKSPFTFIYNKMQFLSGSLKSLKDMGKISYLDYQPKIKHMQSAAQVLKLFAKLLTSPASNPSDNMKEVALKLRNLKPLGSHYYNAVQQARFS